MKMVVASFESVSHASVQAAPRLFDAPCGEQPVGVSRVALDLSKYDGGTDLELLREMPELTTEQQQYLASADDEEWRRPKMSLDRGSAVLSNVFEQPVNKLAVTQTPKYRLRSVLSGNDVPELDAQAWQRAFSQDAGSDAA
eukprot:s1936_g20.t1